MNLLSPTLSDAVNTPGTLKGSSLQKKQTKLPRDHVLELWTHSCGSTPYGTGKKTTHGHGLECGSTSYRTGKTGRELSKLQTSSSRGLRWCRSVPCRTGDYKWHHLSYLCGSCNWKCWEVMVVFSHRTGKTGMDYPKLQVPKLPTCMVVVGWCQLTQTENLPFHCFICNTTTAHTASLKLAEFMHLQKQK